MIGFDDVIKMFITRALEKSKCEASPIWTSPLEDPVLAAPRTKPLRRGAICALAPEPASEDWAQKTELRNPVQVKETKNDLVPNFGGLVLGCIETEF